MKKMIPIFLAAMLMYTLTACGTKTECSFCKEMKKCTAAEFMSQQIKLCEECMEEFNALKDYYSFE